MTLYIAPVIESFRHKGLKRFYENDDRRGLPPPLLKRLAVILADLEVATTVNDLDRPGFRLHALKGDLKGFWSITVSGKWRIIFRFENGNALDVDFLDYH